MKKVFALGLSMAVLLGGQASAGFIINTDNTNAQGVVKVGVADFTQVLNNAVDTVDTINNQLVVRQWGFAEKQGVTLANSIAVDGGTIAAGKKVDSFMIFLNSYDETQPYLQFDKLVTWGFSGNILGVMSDVNGGKEVASTPVLGLNGVTYPGATFNNRGLEEHVANPTQTSNDGYKISGSQLLLKMRVTQPGDWIRVVTESSSLTAPVPEPATMALFGIGAMGAGFVARRRKKA